MSFRVARNPPGNTSKQSLVFWKGLYLRSPPAAQAPAPPRTSAFAGRGWGLSLQDVVKVASSPGRALCGAQSRFLRFWDPAGSDHTRS